MWVKVPITCYIMAVINSVSWAQVNSGLIFSTHTEGTYYIHRAVQFILWLICDITERYVLILFTQTSGTTHLKLLNSNSMLWRTSMLQRTQL